MKPIRINLDIKDNNYESIDLMQGYDYDFEFNITDEGSPYDLTGVLPQIQMQRSNKKFIIQTENITISKDILKVWLDNDLTRNHGNAKLQVVLAKNNRIFGSWVIKIKIKESAINDSDGQSENKVTITEALTQKIAEAIKVKNDTDNLINSGGAAKKEEINRIDLELDKITLKNKNVIININEIQGVKEDPNIDNSEVVSIFINSFDIYRPVTLVIPPGSSWKLTNLTINKMYVTICGGGVLVNSTINLYNISTASIGRCIIENIIMENANKNINAIQLNSSKENIIKNVRFFGYDKCIYIEKKEQFQHVNKCSFNYNFYHNCNYFLYADGLEVYPKHFSTGDIDIIGNKGMCRITNIYLKRVDGFDISSNVCFMEVESGTRTESQNVYVDICNWGRIENNNFFGAGKEGILLEHMQNVNCIGNNIAWCGRILKSAGIRIAKGDITGNVWCISNISDNVISLPSAQGIVISDSCYHVTIDNNTIWESGSTDYYTGSEGTGDISSITVVATAINNKITNNNSPQNNLNILNDGCYVKNNKTQNGIGDKIVQTIIKDMTTINSTKIDTIVLNNQTGTVTTTITGGYEGKEITIVSVGSNNLIGVTGNIKVKETGNFTIPSQKSLTLKFVYGNWQEIGRSF